MWLAAMPLGLAALALLVIFLVRPSFDLAFFLPEPANEQEVVLVERLGQGAGGRLVFAEISAAEAADDLALALGDALADSPHFVWIEGGATAPGPDSIPTAIWRARYLLVDVDWSTEGLRRELRRRLDDLATIGGPGISSLVAADPVFAAPAVLERMRLGGADMSPRWSEGGQLAYLVLETHAAPFDVGAQQAAMAAIEAAFASISTDGGQLELYGVGVYGSRIQALIRAESQRLGLIAAAAVLAVVTLAWRRLHLTMLMLLPLASAILAGLLMASLVFGEIHGITIAFGATLVGVAGDYPMHLFSHARHRRPRESMAILLPTLLISAATAMVAYGSVALSGSRGLAQLGVFSMTGIAVAVLVTWQILPRIMSGAGAVQTSREAGIPATPRLSQRLWIPLLLLSLAALAATGGIRWSDDLGELTPLPAEVLARDQAMRQQFGAPDVRYLLSIHGNTLDEALSRTEVLAEQLADARTAGLISGWSAASTLLPSAGVQARRQSAIPVAAELEQRLAAASAGLPFREDAFAAFIHDAAAARALPLVSPAALDDDLSGNFIAGHLTPVGRGFRSTLYLSGLDEPRELTDWLAARAPMATLIDLKAASESLMRGYRERLLGILLLALMLIGLMVVTLTRDLERLLWSAGTIAAALALTLTTISWLQGAVSLFHMVSLVLVAGLGIDYCLFFSRPGQEASDRRDTLHAVSACALTTVAAFGILATSSIPLLAAIGSTVALGTMTVYLISRAGCRPLA